MFELDTDKQPIPPESITSTKRRVRQYEYQKQLDLQRPESNPLADTPLPGLVQIFLDSQTKIGVRQFADRSKMTRIRLLAIIDGADYTEAEAYAIQATFAEIAQRMDKKPKA